jgi:hypothetical protein
MAGFDSIGGGYLHFWSPRKGEEEPSLHSLRTFGRVPGRCLAVAYCGTVHRGPSPTLQFASAIRPENKLAAGPGWMPGQRQGGPFINSAAPFGEGFRGAGHGNNNVDTLFLVVLRERGAFYLMADGPRARLCAVTETGAGGPYHVALTGGSAHGRFHAAAVADLPPDTIRERVLWTGTLVEEGSDPFLEARVTPAKGTSSVSLVVRDHYRPLDKEGPPDRLLPRTPPDPRGVAPSHPSRGGDAGADPGGRRPPAVRGGDRGRGQPGRASPRRRGAGGRAPGRVGATERGLVFMTKTRFWLSAPAPVWSPSRKT